MNKTVAYLLVGFVISALAVPAPGADQKTSAAGVKTVPQKAKISPEASSTMKKLNQEKARLFGIEFPRKGYTGDHGTTVAKIEFRIKFTKPVKKDTVVPGASLLVDTPVEKNAAGTISWDNDQMFLWTSTKATPKLLTSHRYQEFTVTLKDTVTDKWGNKVDGDRDGVGGGDLQHLYKIGFLDPAAFK
jgi:hypothetical protein